MQKKNEPGSNPGCFMIRGPGPWVPGLQLLLLQRLVSPTGQLWPGPGRHEIGGKRLAEVSFLVPGPVYLPEAQKLSWERLPLH